MSPKVVSGVQVPVKVYLAPESATITDGTKLVVSGTPYNWKRQDNGRDSFPPVNLFVLSCSEFASSPADRPVASLFHSSYRIFVPDEWYTITLGTSGEVLLYENQSGNKNSWRFEK